MPLHKQWANFGNGLFKHGWRVPKVKEKLRKKAPHHIYETIPRNAQSVFNAINRMPDPIRVRIGNVVKTLAIQMVTATQEMEILRRKGVTLAFSSNDLEEIRAGDPSTLNKLFGGRSTKWRRGAETLAYADIEIKSKAGMLSIMLKEMIKEARWKGEAVSKLSGIEKFLSDKSIKSVLFEYCKALAQDFASEGKR